ncbi:hypothetical protein SAMN04488531_1123 [Corynebacterium coyleae]|uniref:DUF7507 domain-containing protein n=1 Tax=Corynebacterium coyleae TaxID=53374 RepID=A0ABX8KZ30_9CORY|nr:hypothetical protein [Corynebacterium coyleae]QXB19465.1 hypothetical protein I6L55_05250 [Corynebacterium coyleae]WJY78748.1 Cna protein B-type domain protein [Corynebacterium coyleae]SEB56723.1 hypothetical protein SAMN04488531_1123 [Corynebacterium coyleae]
MNNASSPFDFNANFSARRSSRRGFSGKRTAIAGMTAVSLALSGLTVPSVVGGEVQVAGAQETNKRPAGSLLQVTSKAVGRDIEIWIAEDSSNQTFNELIFSMRENAPLINTTTKDRRYPKERYTFDEVYISNGRKFVREQGLSASLINAAIGDNWEQGLSQTPNNGPVARITFNKPIATNGGAIKLVAKGANKKGLDKEGKNTQWPYSGGPASSGLTRSWVETAKPGSLSGTVKPGSIQKVELVDANGSSTTVSVNSDGKISASGIPEGAYTLVVTPARGYAKPDGRQVKIKANEEYKLGDITPQREKGSIKGSVTNAPKDSNLKIRVTGVEDATRDVEKIVIVDVNNGEYSVSDLPTGKYRVEVVEETVPGDLAVPDPQSANVTNNGIETKNFELTKRIGFLTVELDTPVPVEVNARHNDNDIYPFGMVDRGFTWGKAPIGSYTVEVKTPERYSVRGEAATHVSENGDGKVKLTVTRDKGSVSGSVDPEAVEKIELVDPKTNERREVSIDSNGNVKLDEIPTGDYTVVVTPKDKDKYTAPKDQTVEVKKDQDTKLENVAPSRDKGSVSGSVDPEAVEKIELVDPKTNERREVSIDSNGNVKLDEIPTGDYTVVVTPKDKDKYTAPKDQTVEVKKDQDTKLENINPTPKPTTSKPTPTPTTEKPTPTSTTEKPTTTKVTVTTSKPTPTSTTEKPTTTMVTTSKPTPTSTTEKPMTTKVTTSKPTPTSTTEKPTPTTTTPAETKPSITGTVKDKDGKPLPQDGEGKPNVTVYGPDGEKVAENVEITDPEGNFEIHGPDDKPLPDGKYIVEVETPEGMNNPRPKIVEVKDGESDPIEFEVDKSERGRKDKSDRIGENTVGGWLIDEHGNPIQGAKIKFIKKDVADPNTISVDPRTEETKGPEYFDYEIPLSVDGDGFFVTPEIDFQYFPEGVVDFDMEIELPEGWPDTDINGKPLNRKVTVKQGERTDMGEIRVKAPIDQSIEGNVNDGNGNAVPGTKVVVTDPNGDSKIIDVDEKGNFKIEDVTPGVNEIEILTPGSDREIDKIKVPVRPGDDVKLPEIQLTKNASLKLEKQVWGRDADNLGQVKDKDGNLVDDVMTTLPGEDLYYELFITNTGDTPIKNIEIDDPELQSRNIELKMPEGWTAELAPGETEVIKAKMKAPEDAFDFNNVATAFGETSTGEKVGSAPDSAYTKFIKAEVHKKVNARFATNPDKPVRMGVGNALKFTYEIQNTGSAPMVNVELKDAIFEGDAKDKDGNDVPADQLKKVKDLEIKKPEGFNGTLLPGQRVIFTAEIPEGLANNVRHHNQAQATGELPTRPARGRGLAGEPDYGDDPSSTLIISPRENLKGNAHIIVDQGAPLADNLRLIAWVDENQNRTQDENEGLAGLKVKLVPTDGGPSIAGETNEDGNVYFESAPWGEYTFEIDNPGNLRLIDPRDPEKNSSRAGSTLESKPFKVRGKFSEPFELRPAADDPSQKEIVIGLQFEKGNGDIAAGGGIGRDNEIVGEDGSSLGKCLATASSVSNPVAWLVPIGLLGAVAGGIGVMFEDELNAAAAQANEAVRSVMPNVNIEVPSVFNQFQAQIDQVNRQLSQINPAAPAAVAGVGLLAVAGLIMGLYYASCQLGWNVETEGSSSNNKAEATETAKPEEPAEPAEA